MGCGLSSISSRKLSQLQWKSEFATCVVMAAPGYPEHPQKGVVIEGDLKTLLTNSNNSKSYFIHAGTKKTPEGEWQTNGEEFYVPWGLLPPRMSLGNGPTNKLKRSPGQVCKCAPILAYAAIRCQQKQA